jgi:tetratricopeptide (TPR) repeat protein
MKRTCFVISPIGEKNSEIRKAADDLYELIIEQALEKYDFEVVRADKISSVSSITAEIIQFVQNADLCIVDITGHNPNVMYECGRRHETGKPYIMVAKDGENLPFDVNTIRTIFYTLTDGRAIRNTVKNIQNIVDKLVKEGFSTSSAGETLSSLADTLNRIERKIDNLSSVNISAANTIVAEQSVDEVLGNLSPTDAFKYALSKKSVQILDAVLPILSKEYDKDTFLSLIVPPSANIGSLIALKIIEGEIDKIKENTNHETKLAIIGAYVRNVLFHKKNMDAFEKIHDYLEDMRQQQAPSSVLSTETKASYLNLLQMAYYGIEDYEKAITICNEAIALSPNESAYYYNQALNYEGNNLETEMVKCIDKYMILDKEKNDYDDDHLKKAVLVYLDANRIEDARSAFNLLKDINPYKAQIIISDNDYRKMLTI